MPDVQEISPAAEPPFPDDAFVLRAGVLEVSSLEANATNHMVDTLHETGRLEWAISVACRGGVSVDELAKEAGEKVWKFSERPRMRASTVGALRARGYDVVPDDLPHALILLPKSPAGADYVAVESTFGAVIANPAYEGAQ